MRRCVVLFLQDGHHAVEVFQVRRLLVLAHLVAVSLLGEGTGVANDVFHHQCDFNIAVPDLSAASRTGTQVA